MASVEEARPFADKEQLMAAAVSRAVIDVPLSIRGGEKRHGGCGPAREQNKLNRTMPVCRRYDFEPVCGDTAIHQKGSERLTPLMGKRVCAGGRLLGVRLTDEA
jgi:hypothetical protein